MWPVMSQKRSVLWVLLFAGVIVHMVNYSCINMAITEMIKLKTNSANETYVAWCIAHKTRGDNTSLTTEENPPPPKSVGEYEWNESDKTVLMGSFSWFMGTSQLIGGLLCQKYGGKLVFGYSNLVMSALGCLIPFAAGFGVKFVIAIRALQGIAGGTGIGVAAKALISKWVPPDERAKFLAVMAGLYGGASFSFYLNGYILDHWGWRYVFYAAGCITGLWGLIWYYFVYENPRDDPNISSTELMYIEKSIGATLSTKKLPVPWLRIFTSVPVIVNTLANIGVMWTTFTFLIYVPTYLKEIHNFEPHQIGQFACIPYLLETLFGIGFAVFADWLFRSRILSVTNIRKLATFISTIVSGVLFGFLIRGNCNTVLILGLLTTAVTFNGASIAGNSANVVDISPNFCAVIHGLQGIIANSMGFVSPSIVGHLTGEEKSVENWNKVFLLTAAINMFSGMLFLLFSDSRVQPWNYENGRDDKEEKAASHRADLLLDSKRDRC